MCHTVEVLWEDGENKLSVVADTAEELGLSPYARAGTA
jgi:hypothetical protein